MLSVSSAETNKSVKDTVIITPAEKASANVISFLFWDLEKNTIKAPITVDRPAIKESNNGIKDWLLNIKVPHKVISILNDMFQ